jgi:hypothetical protein
MLSMFAPEAAAIRSVHAPSLSSSSGGIGALAYLIA